MGSPLGLQKWASHGELSSTKGEFVVVKRSVGHTQAPSPFLFHFIPKDEAKGPSLFQRMRQSGQASSSRSLNTCGDPGDGLILRATRKVESIMTSI